MDKRDLTPQNGELLHEKGHPMLGYRAFALLAEIIQHKETLGLPGKWNRNYELGKNKHWRNTSKKASLVSANLLHTHRTRTVNMLTDNNPTFNVRPNGELPPDKEDLYNTLLKTAEFWWADTEQQGVLEKTVLNGETYGLTIEKMLFNPELEQGLGEIETALADPFHIGWWPLKENNIQKCEGVVHYYPMTVREAQRRWPDLAESITSDKEMLEKLADSRLEVQANSARRNVGSYITSFGNAIKHVLNMATGGDQEGDEVLVCEFWVKDYTRIRSDDGKTEEDLYPGNIRRVTVLNGGDTVVDDQANPSINPTLDVKQAAQTFLWDKFPFIKTHSVTDTGNPWGMSDFEQLEMLNIEVNKTLSQFTLVKDRVARVKLINPQDSGVDNTELNNAPGIINPSSGLVSQAIRYLDPPKIDMNILEALKVYKEFFFLVSGSFDMEQADAIGSNVIAYKAIAALLERAATMLRGKIRNYSGLIRERGRMFISLMQNWYDTERFISYDQDGEDVTEKIKGSELIIPAKLSVVSGSTMPVSNIQVREEALALFDKGAIDNEELLKSMDWPEWKRVIGRMKMGPIGEFLEKLGMMGFPPMFLEAMTEIGQMEMKDFERAIKDGEIPMLQQLLQPHPEQEGIEGPPQDPMEMAEARKVMAEVMKIEADAEKIGAETELVMEKINTEKVNQAATVAGVQFDKVKLTQEQARLVHDIKSREKDDVSTDLDHERADKETEIKKTDSDTKKSIAEQGPFREKGMQSDNKSQKPKKK
jgi:hypothetical protein